MAGPFVPIGKNVHFREDSAGSERILNPEGWRPLTAAVSGVEVETTPVTALLPGTSDPEELDRHGAEQAAGTAGVVGADAHTTPARFVLAPSYTVGTDIVGPKGKRARTARPPPGRGSTQTVPCSVSTSWATIHIPSPVERFGP